MWDHRMRNNSVPNNNQELGNDSALLQSQQPFQRRLPVVVDHVTKAEAAMHQGTLYRPPPEGHEFPPTYYEESRPPLPPPKQDPYFKELTKTFRSSSLTAVNSVSVKDRIALFSQCNSSHNLTSAPANQPRTPCAQYPVPAKSTSAVAHSSPTALSRWHSAASLLTSDRRPSYVSTYPETQLLRRPGYDRSSSSSTLISSFLQERRSSTSSKLKGLVVPQGPTKPVPSSPSLPLIGPSASWRPTPLVPTSFQLSHSKPVTPPLPERPVLVSPLRSSCTSTPTSPPPPLPLTSPPAIPPPISSPVLLKSSPVNLNVEPSPPSLNKDLGLSFRNPIERLDSLLGAPPSCTISAVSSVSTVPCSNPAPPVTPPPPASSPKSCLSPPPQTAPAQRVQSVPNETMTTRARFWSLRDDSDDDSNSVISLRTEDSRQTADDSLSDADSLHQERSDFRPRRLSQQRTVLSSTAVAVVTKQPENTDSVSQFRALAEKWESRAVTNGPAAVVASPPSTIPTNTPTFLYQTGNNVKSPRSGSEMTKLPPSLQPRSVLQDTKSVLPLLERSVSTLDLVGSRLQRNSRSVSVSDIRKSFETKKQTSEHRRFSSMDSTASDSGVGTPGGLYGSASSLHAGTHSVGADGFGSATSLASDESCSQSSSTNGTSALALHDLLDQAATLLEAEAAGLGGQCKLEAVVLHKDSPQGPVGITLAGGADYEIKEITVHKVILGSLADRDGKLQKGDRILSINGRSLHGLTHRQALDLLKAHRQEVILVTSRTSDKLHAKISETRSSTLRSKSSETTRRSTNLLSDEKTAGSKMVTSPVEVSKEPVKIPAGGVQLHLLKDGAGLGFSLDGGQGSPLGDRPLTVKRVFKGGAADREGHLHVGDQVLLVGSQPVSTMTRTEAWNFMKKLPDGPVTLTVRPFLPTKEDTLPN